MSAGSSTASDGVVLFGDKIRARPRQSRFQRDLLGNGRDDDHQCWRPVRQWDFCRYQWRQQCECDTHSGSQINAANNGIDVYAAFNDGNGGAYVNSNGSIVAGGDGVFALNNNEGLVQIVNTGKIGFDRGATAVSRVGLHGVAALTNGFATSPADTTHGFLSIRNDGEIYASQWGILSATLGGRAEILNRGVINSELGSLTYPSHPRFRRALPASPDPTVAAPATIINEGTIRAFLESIVLR